MLSTWLVNQEMSIDYRPNDPSVLADPFPIYQRMRDEDPAHWSPVLKAWVLTRYEDVKRACLDSRMSSDRLRPFFATLSPGEAEHIAQLMRVLALWMVFRDPPEHTRLRRLASKVFNVRSIHALRPNVEALTSWLLERIGDREEFDFIAEFAGLLPALVIMDMLGVPHSELQRLKEKAWHAYRSPFHRRRWDEAGFHPSAIASIEAVAGILSRIPYRVTDRQFIAAPLFHGWGLTNLLLGLARGGRWASL